MRPERTFRKGLAVPISATLLLGAGVLTAEGPSARADTSVVSAVSAAAADESASGIGAPFSGIDLTAFAEAKAAFANVEDINDGLGPTFNERACGNCHTTPVVGGSGANIEQRFGRSDGSIFFGFDTDEDNEGGTLRQLFSNGTYTSNGQSCTIPLDTQPPTANVSTGRRTTPLFGLGLVDALPDSVFQIIATNQPASIRGVVQTVSVPLPDERDPTQSVGSMRVGRFGLKGIVASLTVFSADAYDNEMGITTQHCYKGTSVLEFATENFPNNIAPPAGCNGGDLAPANPVGDPQVPEFTDDVVGDCDNGRSELQEDVHLFRTFMESLAPPPIVIGDANQFVRGAFFFGKDGCVGCHFPAFVTPAHPFNGVPGNFAFAPFSDFLGHDMGSLGDGIGQTGDPVARTRVMRTAPLWGARFNTQFLHDGRAKSVKDAILAHEGQGAAARDAFKAEKASDQAAVVAFINSI